MCPFNLQGGHMSKKQNRNRRNQLLNRIHLNAAGIDIGAATHYVAVPPGRDPEGKDVRSFATFTADLYQLAQWLKECEIDKVAMESTGVYWIALFEILDAKGFEVILVNPRHFKNVPGRKTDVVDCQWLLQLHTFGLLQGSFRPDYQICELRAYLRQRAMLISYAAKHIQHMQKALEQMNIKLSRVISDITGTTGMKIIRSILAGERNPEKLANLRNPRCKNDIDVIAKALHGNWKAEHLFSLQQAVELFDFYKKRIDECEVRIQKHLETFEDQSNDKVLPSGGRKSKAHHPMNFDGKSLLYKMTGVDLTRVDGLDVPTGLCIVSEIGLDMTRWPTEKNFSSWLALSPGSKITGGKALSSKTKVSANRAAKAFRLAAYSIQNSKSALGAFYRRKKAQLGAPKAITATAHKIAIIVYHMLKRGTEYKDLGQHYYEQRYRSRMINNLKNRARQFGLKMVIDPESETLTPVLAN
jgi:transposase